ncbi:MAG: lipopolysaccharide biosynthesis protein RfbH [Candidatus Cloacimonetes bacterium]|nr:lipopolysaccharide biosynthesis protein RfbH [Candidatus Cloacimonadota bacterium]
MSREQELRAEVLSAVTKYYDEVYGNTDEKTFQAGERIGYGGRIFDAAEMRLLTESALDFWLTAGRYARQFEKEFAEFLGVRHVALTNSGSSANLLAFMALTSSKLGERRIGKGDEVITVAAGFPTTVAPIVQYGAVPVFVDVEIPSYEIDVKMLEQALSEKTKAVMVAHTLGNAFNLTEVKAFCDRHRLWLVEDNCDALGTKYKYKGEWRYTGAIGDIGTSSFYPPHHMTMGEGGAVYTNSAKLKQLIESFRDWGRDCHCGSGQDNACGCRFSGQHGELPAGYDHKYVYAHLGYNLKATDMQAAIGCAQLKKLPSFIAARRQNWQFLREALTDLEKWLILPEAEAGSEPSWFGFMLTVRDDACFGRDELVQYLEAHNIQTRMLFAGNLLRQPCFDELRESGSGYRVVGSLANTDTIMKNTFWLGVYPGMDEARLEYMAESIHSFVEERLK